MIYQDKIITFFENGKITVQNSRAVDALGTIIAEIPSDFELSAYSSLVSESGDVYAFCPMLKNEKETVLAIAGAFEAGQTVTLSFSDEPAPELSAYPETLKTMENDFLHITVNDSGTLVISDKESGNVYFEMLTAFTVSALSEVSAVYRVAGNPEIEKYSSPLLTFFDVRTSVPAKNHHGITPYSHFSQVYRIAHRIALAADERALRVTSLLGEIEDKTNFKAVLRFPTGADFPTVRVTDGLGNDELRSWGEIFALSKDCCVIVSGESGSCFGFTPLSHGVTVSVSEDGNIDVTMPIDEKTYDAPVNKEHSFVYKQTSFSYKLTFEE